MEEELTESEREQLKRINALRKVACVILLKWIWQILTVFTVSLGVFSAFFVWRSAKSVHRFDALTRLLYTPRHISKIETVSDKQLLTIIDRKSLMRRVGNRLPMELSEKECLTIDLEIKQERKPSNLFTLTAHAPTWVGAVKKVNAYAEVLIEEYVAYRTRELENWRESIMVRKKSLQDQIAELESEESTARGQVGVASPSDALTTLNHLLSDQRRNLSMLSVQIVNEEVKKKKLDEFVGNIGPMIIASAAAIKKKSAEIAAVDAELVKLREVYTDLNPKVKGKVEERAALLEGYMKMLKEKGMSGIALEDIDRIEKAASELAEISLKIEALEENRRSLELEIRDNEAKSAALTAAIPAIERIRIKRNDLERTLRDLEDQLDNLSYLQMSTANDLQQIERAGGAGDKRPLNVKTFTFSAIATGACTGSFALLLLLVELVWGRVRNAKELAAHGDVEMLGSLPKEGALSKDEEKDVLGVVALKFTASELPKGIVLVNRLPGAPEQPKFRDALNWSLAMSGAQSFALSVVDEAGFEPPEGAETLLNAVCKGLYGWFPVENRYVLAPTELQMLQTDIAELRKQYDHVFLFVQGGCRRGGSFFDQLLTVIDCTLVVVGADRTPRSWLSYVRRHVQAAGKPMMGLVTGAAAKEVRREMEAKK